MTPTDRTALLEIARLVVAAMVEADDEVKEVTLSEVMRRLAVLCIAAKKADSRRFQVELGADEIAMIMVALEKLAKEHQGEEMGEKCGELLEGLRGL